MSDVLTTSYGASQMISADEARGLLSQSLYERVYAGLGIIDNRYVNVPYLVAKQHFVKVAGDGSFAEPHALQDTMVKTLTVIKDSKEIRKQPYLVLIAQSSYSNKNEVMES